MKAQSGTGRCPVNLPPHAQLCSWGWLSGTYSHFSRTPGHRSRWERKKKKDCWRLFLGGGGLPGDAFLCQPRAE